MKIPNNENRSLYTSTRTFIESVTILYLIPIKRRSCPLNEGHVNEDPVNKGPVNGDNGENL
ncbi:40521_t:CDS:2 [Gigaspora margarita]|uniref:40521_t:CDS:1 n=1 Tax=Gigaspora margarita TaxID=4874 RepID=A0ABM8W0N0_GIGMA|nr:40521_t:CDS:2 [Gigaspora margarita]